MQFTLADTVQQVFDAAFNGTPAKRRSARAAKSGRQAARSA
jgi:hypothetical protein